MSSVCAAGGGEGGGAGGGGEEVRKRVGGRRGLGMIEFNTHLFYVPGRSFMYVTVSC